MARTAGRNDLCPCGSGRKFKKCCERKLQGRQGGRTMMYVVLALIIGAIVAGVVSLRETSYSTGAAGREWSPEHGHYH